MQAQTQKESDTQIRTMVATQIDWEPEITSRDVSIAVHDGVVTLTGFVHNYYEKLAAERAAKSVYGVKGVANDVEVRPGVRTDPEIARDAVHALDVNVTLPKDRITVTVKDGYVTLDGNVEWNYQRSEAAACAHRVRGVRGVDNRIQVRPAVSGADVRTKIEEALRRNAELDARRISVVASDGVVNLYGNVRSWFEREEAERAAWSAPGVKAVMDHLAVMP